MQARAIFEKLTAAIKQHWDAVSEEAELNEVDRRMLWQRQFLNPFSTGLQFPKQNFKSTFTLISYNYLNIIINILIY